MDINYADFVRVSLDGDFPSKYGFYVGYIGDYHIVVTTDNKVWYSRIEQLSIVENLENLECPLQSKEDLDREMKEFWTDWKVFCKKHHITKVNRENMWRTTLAAKLNSVARLAAENKKETITVE